MSVLGRIAIFQEASLLNAVNEKIDMKRLMMEHSGTSSLVAASKPSSSSLETRNKLLLASKISACFVVLQMIGGHLSGSLAVWSDAAHLMTDLMALLIAMMASHLALKPPTEDFTYGFNRIESLTALFSVFSLILIAIWLMYNSILRFVSMLNQEDFFVDGAIMSITAAIGLVINLTLALVLRENHVHLPGAVCNHSHTAGFKCIHEVFADQGTTTNVSHDSKSLNFGDIEMPPPSCMECPSDNNSNELPDYEEEGFIQKETKTKRSALRKRARSLLNKAKKNFSGTTPRSNINLDAAFYHTMTDLLQSVILLITGCIIWWKPHWYILDPVLTFLYSCFVIYGAIPIMKRSASVLLDAKPSNIRHDRIHDAIVSVSNVHSVCALRVWSVSDANIGLTCHICVTSPGGGGGGRSQKAAASSKTAYVLKKVMSILKDDFGIDGQYVTIQIYTKDRHRFCPSCGIEAVSKPTPIV